jgi:hypothetical protein
MQRVVPRRTIDVCSADPTEWHAWSRWSAYRAAARAGLYWAGSANVMLVLADGWALLTKRPLLWTGRILDLTVLAQFVVWPLCCLLVAALVRAVRYVV